MRTCSITGLAAVGLLTASFAAVGSAQQGPPKPAPEMAQISTAGWPSAVASNWSSSATSRPRPANAYTSAGSSRTGIRAGRRR